MLCVLAIFLLGVVPSFAALTSVELVDRGDVLDSKSFGAAGPYERVVARAYFAIDPKLPQNRIIADIDRAPRDENGLVEFSADLYVIKPCDSAKATAPRWLRSRIAAVRDYSRCSISGTARTILRRTPSSATSFCFSRASLWSGWAGNSTFHAILWAAAA